MCHLYRFRSRFSNTVPTARAVAKTNAINNAINNDAIFLKLPTDVPVVLARLASGYVLDTLREGDDLKLVCDVQSNPPPTRVTWYRDVSRKRSREERRASLISLLRRIRNDSSIVTASHVRLSPGPTTGARRERRSTAGF